MLELFHNYFYVPFYNLFVFLIGIVPNGDVGIAIVIATLFAKVLTLPFSLSAVKTQKAMKHLEPKLKELKELHKDNKEQQAKEMMNLYKEHKVKPFSSILVAFIQIPVFIAVYLVFQHESLAIDPALLYSFVAVPQLISPLFLGFIAVNKTNFILAVIAVIAQFLQVKLTIQAPPKAKKTDTPSMQDDMARAMSVQMQYMLPVIIGIAAYTSGALALYFITSAVFTIVQELFIRITTGKETALPIEAPVA